MFEVDFVAFNQTSFLTTSSAVKRQVLHYIKFMTGSVRSLHGNSITDGSRKSEERQVDILFERKGWMETGTGLPYNSIYLSGGVEMRSSNGVQQRV